MHRSLLKKWLLAGCSKCNDMIDLHATRLAAFRNRVPFVIYVILFVISIITLWLVGYFGTLRQRARVLMTTVVLLA